MALSYQILTPDFVNLIITTSVQDSNYLERRFQKSLSVDELKGKLELLTGGNSATMKIELYDRDDSKVCALDNNASPLGSYPVEDGMRLHVIDSFVLQNELSDLSKVQKFELSDEMYAKREDTLKSFLERNRLGKYNEEEMKRREEDRKKDAAAEEAVARSFSIGDRCEIKVSGQPSRRGTVMFCGLVDFKEGWWVGVKYDEPLGKNNGSVNGKSYFECPPKYGGFVRPSNVTVGEFPEDIGDLDEM